MKGNDNCIKIMKRERLYNDDAFRLGQILEFCPGYHTSKNYFVEVVFYDKNAVGDQVKMITSIPGQHECKMYPNNNWDYHSRRVVNIYNKKDFPQLLLNQKLN